MRLSKPLSVWTAFVNRCRSRSLGYLPRGCLARSPFAPLGSPCRLFDTAIILRNSEIPKRHPRNFTPCAPYIYALWKTGYLGKAL